MPVTTTLLDVPIHLQNDEDNCGEACAQMIVAFLTGQVPGSQNGLAAAKVLTAGWHTSPAGLAAMVNARLPPASRKYERQRFGSAASAWAYAEAAVRIGRPVAVLIDAAKQNSHWVVLKGRLPDAGGVVCRDPTPPRTILQGIAAIDHHGSHDECRIQDQASSDAVGEISTLKDFLRRMKPATLAPEKGRVVVVGPVLTATELAAAAGAVPSPQGLAPAAAGEAPLDAASAVRRGLATLGLKEDAFWARLDGRAPERVNSLTRRVRSATPGISDYYLAPLFDDEGTPRAAAVLDDTRRQVLRIRALPADYLARLFAPAIDGSHPPLVWGAFKEMGMSPFFPAEALPTPEAVHALATAQAAPVPGVRRILDGREFDSLTPSL